MLVDDSSVPYPAMPFEFVILCQEQDVIIHLKEHRVHERVNSIGDKIGNPFSTLQSVTEHVALSATCAMLRLRRNLTRSLICSPTISIFESTSLRKFVCHCILCYGFNLNYDMQKTYIYFIIRWVIKVFLRIIRCIKLNMTCRHYCQQTPAF